VRHCVIDHRITQQAGRRCHERVWTAIATCGKQQPGFFEFLYEPIAAKSHDSLIKN